MMETRNVAVLGASPKPDRFANKAVRMLIRHGFNVLPVNPAFTHIEGLPCFKNLSDITEPIDTVTLYLGEKNSMPLIDEIIAVHPRRIIMNPGAHNDTLEEKARESGIEVEHDCTLVMLGANAF
ncbi:MAG TPA: CoA-binding protein [Patescibacteria group bacterium]|nr:CoA-binding protein [Patescibacteria group bacterium]